ncbi:MAG: pyruvate formate-lyase-activating protein [Clostridia bacterium]
MVEGRIHSFESLGAVDGPGIRFIIFMQGCSLQCQYCQNRDTWDIHGGTTYTVEQVLEKVRKYKNYIMPNGGVTISGGEPLLQPHFLIALLQELKKEGIHTCIDTSGSFTITTTLQEVIDLTDLFLLDIKCIDDEKCLSLTGISNQKELAFAHYLSDHHKAMWIRQVLIPGITDKEEDLIHLREFITTLKTVERVEFLPYHDLGKFKWNELHLNYPLEGVRTANQEDVKRAQKILGI